MTIIRHDFPGSNSAQALTSVSVPDRYLVVRLAIFGAPVYIHNVYAPVNSVERKRFSINSQRDILNTAQCTSFVAI